MIRSHLTEFAGRTVTRLADVTEITDNIAVRLADEEWDDSGENIVVAMVAQLVARPDTANLTALVVGAWGASYDTSSAPIVSALVEAAASFPKLTAVFFGDMTSEEAEITWIHQSDISPLLNAYPALEQLVVRGGEGLAFSALDGPHNALRSLKIQSGGLSAQALGQIAALDLPQLEELDLWLGTSQYGGNATVDDVAALVASLPSTVTTLGLANSEIAPEIAAAIHGWPIVNQLEVLNLSMGTLLDEHVSEMLGALSYSHLRELDLRDNHLSDEYADELNTANPNIRSIGQREAESYNDTVYYYVAVGE